MCLCIQKEKYIEYELDIHKNFIDSNFSATGIDYSNAIGVQYHR